MAEDDKTEEAKAPEKPARKSRTAKSDGDSTVARPVRSRESATESNEALGTPEEDRTPAKDKVIKKGQDIEVKTDEDGIALETVWEERDLLNTERKAVVLVAAQGTLVPAHLRAK